MFQKQIGDVHAVDGVDLDIYRARRSGWWGRRGAASRTLARVVMRLYDATEGTIEFEGQDITHAARAASCATLRREMQMIFQDPYASLNPRKTVGSIIGAPFRLHKIVPAGQDQGRGAGADGAGGAEPRALQPLPARVLGRPAPADRRRARARPAAQADRVRRAGLGARRLDPGADPEPARGSAGGVRPDVPVHRARPVGREARLRPGRRDVPGQDRRDGRGRDALPRTPSTRTRARCSRRCPIPDPDSPRRRSGSSWRATSRRPIDPPSGCRFHPRCPNAQFPKCSERGAGAPSRTSPGQVAACHFPLEDRAIIETPADG